MNSVNHPLTLRQLTRLHDTFATSPPGSRSHYSLLNVPSHIQKITPRSFQARPYVAATRVFSDPTVRLRARTAPLMQWNATKCQICYGVCFWSDTCATIQSTESDASCHPLSCHRVDSRVGIGVQNLSILFIEVSMPESNALHRNQHN